MSPDVPISTWFAAHHRPLFTTCAWAVTAVGSEVSVAVLTVVLATVLWARRRFDDALMVGVAMAGAAALVVGLKHLVRRDRPGAEFRVVGAPPDASYSFPSGHTLFTTVLLIVSVALLWPSLGRRARALAAAAAATVALGVAVSRVYLGYHWATDVLASLVIGSVWCAALLRWGRQHLRVPTGLEVWRDRQVDVRFPSKTPAMSESTTTAHRAADARTWLNKVPEVTAWFWVIKILCTTVGESFADWINMQLGVGLVNTAWIFTGVLVMALAWQLTRRRYVPFVYWFTVVVVSVTGTLYTDILTDQWGVPLWQSSTAFAAVLALVFGIWWARERTLSIHSIVTLPREAFYWLAVLVTFALGTATGDWTLDLTGWSPGVAVLLPLSLIAVVTALWKYGMNPVLSFWLAYILTRPLGANIGDFLGLSRQEHGLGLGTFATSLIFLAAILATVVYLTLSKADVIETRDSDQTARDASSYPTDGSGLGSSTATRPDATPNPVRQRIAAGVLAGVVAATAGLLTWAHHQPHQNAQAEGPAPTCSQGAPLAPAGARQRVATAFPSSEVSTFRAIAHDTLGKVLAGDQAGAQKRATDLETAWDDGQAVLQPKDCQAWTYVDGQIDPVLQSVRADHPNSTDEQAALSTLLTTLS